MQADTAPRTDLELIRLVKDYGASLAVAGIDLKIAAGSYCCLLGPSGCGKTSTLRMIAGHEEPTEGSIVLGGREITHLSPAERGTAMMFQSYALFPHLSVLDNVAFSARMKGAAKAERHARAMELLKLVHMEPYAERLPAALSGGQQQRVALARSLAKRPKLLLLDEPLGALDKQLREHMQFEIKALHERLGITVVYVTHDQGEALTMSDRIAVFNDGRIQQLARHDHRAGGDGGERRVLDAVVVVFDPDQHAHFATPSALSLPTSSSTSATLTPAWRLAGSVTLTTVRRGATSTP